MDVLRRYEGQRTYEDLKGNSFSGRYKRVSKDLSYTLQELDKPSTFDKLSLQHYGTPLMFWLIADFNDYIDPTVDLPIGTKLRIPVIE